MANARQIAVKALLRVNESGAYSNLAIDALLDESGLPARGRAFASALFYGVLERRITLDYCIARYSRLPLDKLSPEVRDILRSAFYQIMYMDSVPASAAVNESVKLAAHFRRTSAGSLINAVLRSFLRDGGKLPDLSALDETSRISIEYSCPEWIVRLWRESYGGADMRGLLAASLGARDVFLRANTRRVSAEQLAESLRKDGADCVRDTQIPGCVRLRSPGRLEATAQYADGLFHVQDKSSQLCALALGAMPGERVMDVCAAPGGKSFTIAQHMNDEGLLLSMDMHPGRVNLIEEGKKRLGLNCIIPTVNNGTIYNHEYNDFDRVLCDVPCSGLGIMGRKPEIKYKDKDELLNLPALQYKILEISSKYVRAGGALMYSTCTLNPAENEGVINRFLEEHREFEPAPLVDEASAGECFTVTLMPHIHGTDGFFIALMRRKK